MGSYQLARVVQRYMEPRDQLAIYGEFDAGSSMSFYLHRRAWIYNGRYNNLAFGSRYPDAPRIFLTDADFPAFWGGHQRVFLFIPANKRNEAAEHLRGLPKWKVVELGGKIVYANQPLDRDGGHLTQAEISEPQTRREADF
jgi:hypothetical protein